MTTRSDVARAYARHGTPVFPCAGKRPLTRHGYKDATSDVVLVTAYWEKFPDANIGMPTGAASGRVVLDIDTHTLDGFEVLRELEWENGALPETLTALTGGGGEHRYFEHVPGSRCGTLAPGIDLKGDGGYVILPPSVHVSGQTYTWDSHCAPGLIATLPAWVLAQLAPRLQTDADSLTRDAEIPVGQRNSTLTLLAGVMRRYGMSREAIAAALHAENAARCAVALPAVEVERIATSVARYAPAAAPGLPSAEILSAALRDDIPAERIRFRTAAEIARETPSRAEFILHGYVARGSVTELTGRAKAAGKTTFIMHGIRSILDGVPFLGQPTAPTAVVYLTEERPPTFREALRRADLTDREDLHVLYWSETGGAPWADVARAAVAECQRRGASLLVVDTVSQFGGLRGDAENNAGDAFSVLQPLQEAAALGIGVVAVRHERKGGGEVGESGRGSSAFAGAVDIVVALRRMPGDGPAARRVLHALSRFDETPEELAIELADDGYVALGSIEDVAARAAYEALLDRLPTSVGDAQCLSHLMGLLGEHKRTSVQAALSAGMADGTITRIGAGRRGDPYRYWGSADGRPGPLGSPLASNEILSARTSTLERQKESAVPLWGRTPT